MSLKQTDTEIFSLIKQETKRQKEGLEMIPSENWVMPEIREAMGSILTNKYSEGYPHKRYYGGNEFIDEAERLCQQRALDTFRLNPEEWGVNVQRINTHIQRETFYVKN